MPARRTTLAAVLVVLTSLVAAGPAAGEPVSQARPSPDRALHDALQRIVDAGVPAAVGHSTTRRTQADGAAGSADVSTGEPARATHRLRAGSTTKTFVATVVLQLVDEGRLTLDTPLAQVLPDTPVRPAQDIRVRHLLQHTSGVPDHSEDPRIGEPYQRDLGFVWDPAELVAVAAEHPAHFAPGQGWRYSNTNYVLLGQVVERLTGHTLRHELATRIVRPLRLDETEFPQRRTPLRGQHLHGYVPGPDGPLDVTALSTSWAWAAGSLTSTPADLARFYRALLRGRLLPPALLAVMLDATASHGTGYGLGIGRVELPCGPAYGHEGSVAGYWTLAYASPDGARAAVVAVTSGVMHTTEQQRQRTAQALETAFCPAQPSS